VLPATSLSIRVRTVPCEVTVLLPIYNKAAYLSTSLPSIFNLSIDPTRVCILCYDDGSTDKSIEILREYQLTHPQITVIEGKINRGTLVSRIRLIEATKSPWLVFLDPDDEFYGSGMVEALDLIKQIDADIVQFGCRMVFRRQRRQSGCWREPHTTSLLTAASLTNLWLHHRVDVHMHRKVWRTELFQRTVSGMSAKIREMRIMRTEDILLYGHVLLQMKGFYKYIPTVGEIRHYGWGDNSQSQAYGTKAARAAQMQFVANWTARYLGKAMYA
jgi:glycosyltransferase involved in cell wall biosynthesis